MNTTRTLCFVIAALASYAALVHRLCQARRQRADHPAAVGGVRRDDGAPGAPVDRHRIRPQHPAGGALPARRRAGPAADGLRHGQRPPPGPRLPPGLHRLPGGSVRDPLPVLHGADGQHPHGGGRGRHRPLEARLQHLQRAGHRRPVPGPDELLLGPAATRLLDWARAYRSYRALYPLWRDLYESSPDIALEPPGASVSDLDYRLHRRVVEIRDGWRDLRPYIDRAAPGTDLPDAAAEGAGTEQRQAVTEAAQIRRALSAKRAGTVPRDNKDAGDFDDRNTDNFRAEVAWLTRVVAAYSKLGEAS
ncbi:MAB_1171c family putative transporter [Streptomyces sp. NPDC085612]|uniref:MAB_1171c family putative transporter n=1 Tax=Streptomyces sp. NPDC085612 TaxID=3365732 RepID=UPI0037CCF005